MRIDLNAKVTTRDGEVAGKIHYAIFDEGTKELTHFVVSTGGLFGKDVLVPRALTAPGEVLAGAPGRGSAMVLNMTRAELERMADFTSTDYTTPPAGWEPPSTYWYPIGGILWGGGFDAGSPEPPTSGRSEDVEDSWEGAMIERGAEVVDRRGKRLGTLEEVKLDPDTGRLQSALVHIGGLVQDLLGAGRTLEVTGEIIAAVEQGRIRLSVSVDELMHSADSGDMAA